MAPSPKRRQLIACRRSGAAYLCYVDYHFYLHVTLRVGLSAQSQPQRQPARISGRSRWMPHGALCFVSGHASPGIVWSVCGWAGVVDCCWVVTVLLRLTSDWHCSWETAFSPSLLKTLIFLSLHFCKISSPRALCCVGLPLSLIYDRAEATSPRERGENISPDTSACFQGIVLRWYRLCRRITVLPPVSIKVTTAPSWLLTRAL